MKKQTYSFPSLYETVGTDLKFVSKSLDKGMQLYDNDDQGYIVGKLALTEGRSPNKLINSSPNEIDYQLLLKSSLLLATENNNRPLVITTGFPFSTYQIYKDAAKKMIEQLGVIKYNPGTYSNKEKTTFDVNISKVEILPEMIGNIIALRAGETQAEGNFFVVSFGYGTCETVLSTEDGIVHRTSKSITGMQYAVDLFMRSLATKYYLGLKTEKQLDISFRNDHIILDRKKIDIRDLRKKILERYYRDVVSIGLRKSFSDTDFEMADKIYVTGGGALFTELVDELRKEFNEVATVEIVKNPLTLTSEGYSLNSVMLADGDTSVAVGLDIGNANTVLTQYEPEQKETVKEKPEEKKKTVDEPVVYIKAGVKQGGKTENTVIKKDKTSKDAEHDKREDKHKNLAAKKDYTPSKAEENIANQLINIVDEIVSTSTKKPKDTESIASIKVKKEIKKDELASLSEEEKNILSRENNGKKKTTTDIFDNYKPDFS